MKKAKILIVSFLSLVTLTGCKNDNTINENSDISRNNTDLTTSTFINQQENNMDNQNSVPPETKQTFSANYEQYSQSRTETTAISSLQEQQTSNEITTSKSEEIVVSEFLPETVQSDTTQTTSIPSLQEQQTSNETTTSKSEEIVEIPILHETFVTQSYPSGITKYTNRYCGNEFIILNITLKKIYWNELEGYDVKQGQTLDIAIPAIFEDWVSDADEIMMYMNKDNKTFGDLLFKDEKMIKGMTYPQYWNTDYLCPIKDGVVCFGEYTDNIRNTFSRIDDGVYIEEANFWYSEFPFEDNMSVSNLDMYFETIKKDYDILTQEIIDNPDTDYELPGFWGYQDGIRFRAAINDIY